MVCRCPRRSAGLRCALALTLMQGTAHAGPPTSGAQARPGPPAVDAEVLAAEGQARRDAGDLAGAALAWQRALASLPVTQATAHRRGGLVLAIAAAHEAGFERGGAEKELRAALEVLDGYLAGLDPTDDENRVAVEQRRAAVAGRLARVRAAAAETDAAEDPRPQRRGLWVAGGTVTGLGVVSLAVLGLGLGLGAGADRALASAVARPGDDPDREAAKAAALDQGHRANDAALAGGVIGGVLLVTGVALIAAAASRGRRPREARVSVRGAGLQLRF